MAFEPIPTVETARKLGLLPEEFDRIKEILGRTPNFTELSIFSVMWSEHCSYKNSIVWLKTLPRDGERMLAKAGEENAGLVDLGDGLACSFKIESHNHPSALEPYQGAATGVGGINRDIFTMGARPIAQLNSLRFGNPKLAKTKWHVRGVVKGIGDYGNAFGVPTVGGEVYFDDCYNTNPLVNAFSAGIVEVGKTASAVSYGEGNPVFIVGSATGRDGIHGATFASEDITAASTDKLPAVQVGDPFMEKLLLEATLEAIASGQVIGIQDMGAAGIICSTSEMSAKGKHGMEVWLDKVPMRQPNMKPFEILLSESQERMLIVARKGAEDQIKSIFQKWDLHCSEIGRVTNTQRLHFYYHGDLVADVPAEALVLGGGAPVYHREYREPAYFKIYQQFDPELIPLPDYAKVARYLLRHPNICSRKWISRQYDSMVGTANLNTNNPSDASVVNIKGTKKAIVISVDCNSRYVHANPRIGAAIAVAESARNIVCSGGIPVAITNCLNFGNPYNPEVYWQFVEAIHGMREACLALGTPVTGGNVSFYNQSTDDGPVFPTPTIGMLGIMDDCEQILSIPFKQEGDLIYLIGPASDDIASSEYLYSFCEVKQSPAPRFDLATELRVQQFIQKSHAAHLLQSAHDVSDGGIFIALAECAIFAKMGFEISTIKNLRKDGFLFGEAQSRVIVTVRPGDEAKLQQLAKSSQVPITLLGVVRNKHLMVDGELYCSLKEAEQVYYSGLDLLFGSD